MTKEEYIAYFKNKYPYIEENDLSMTYHIAKENLLNTLFPFDDTQTEVPPRYEYKLIEVMDEIIDLGNMRNYTSYRENGVVWERDYSGISSLSNITP